MTESTAAPTQPSQVLIVSWLHRRLKKLARGSQKYQIKPATATTAAPTQTSGFAASATFQSQVAAVAILDAAAHSHAALDAPRSTVPITPTVPPKIHVSALAMPMIAVKPTNPAAAKATVLPSPGHTLIATPTISTTLPSTPTTQRTAGSSVLANALPTCPTFEVSSSHWPAVDARRLEYSLSTTPVAFAVSSTPFRKTSRLRSSRIAPCSPSSPNALSRPASSAFASMPSVAACKFSIDPRRSIPPAALRATTVSN